MMNAPINARMWPRPRLPSSCRNVDPITVGLERSAERPAACGEVGERVGFVGGLAEDCLMAVIMAHEAETVDDARSVVERQFGDHSDPVRVRAPAMTGLEAEIAKPVVHRPSLVDLDRQ